MEEDDVSQEQLKTLHFIQKTINDLKYKPAREAIIRNLESKILHLRTLDPQFCKYCFRSWSDGLFTLKVRPKPVLGKRVRKILRKEQKTPKKLTIFEKKLLQLVKRKEGNKLVLTCLCCKKMTISQMPKCKHDNRKTEKESATKVKKKKKKKDIFVGLNPEVVLKTSLMNKILSGKPHSTTATTTTTTTTINNNNNNNNNNNTDNNTDNLNISKKKTNQSQTSSMTSLNEQKKNMKLQASSQKTRIQQINSTTISKPNYATKNKDYNTSTHIPVNNNSLRDYSFFQKLDMKKDIENRKQNEKLKNIKKQNEKMRKIVSAQMKNNQKSNKNYLKNFLQEFGNPMGS